MQPPKRFRRLRKTIRVALPLLVAAYLIAILFGHLGDRLILLTNHDTLDPHGAARQLLSVDGQTVEVWTARSPGATGHEPKAFVLRFAGQGDRADRWIAASARAWG